MKNDIISVFGEVLFDIFQDDKRILGGAPFNVAWHLQALGLNPQFISRVGADQQGHQIRQAMHLWGMNLDYLQEDSTFPTGQVKVSINHGEPTYSILADQAYDHIQIEGLEKIKPTGIFYHGTLAARSMTSNQTLRSLKNLHPGKVFVDVNLRQPWWNKTDVIEFLKDADWVKLNIHEFKAINDSSGVLRSNLEKCLSQFNLEGIIVTQGEKGALALDSTGKFISVSPDTSVELIDTVGAGDALSAIFLLGLNLEWNLSQIMDRAQCFASAITGQQGATVNNPKFYQPFKKLWDL